jgi:hypothetical protein
MKYKCMLCKATDKRLIVRPVIIDNDNNAVIVAMCKDCWSYAMKKGLSEDDLRTVIAEL